MALNHGTPPFRVNQVFFGPFERRALPWIARRLPARIVPDHMTFLGLIAALIIGAAYFLTRFDLDWLWLANAGLVLHWLGDSLDGTLARVRHIEREKYGFFCGSSWRYDCRIPDLHGYGCVVIDGHSRRDADYYRLLCNDDAGLYRHAGARRF